MYECLAVRESNIIASRWLIFASFGVISLARLIPCFAKSHQNPSKINSPWGAKQFWRSRFFREQSSFRRLYINITKGRTVVIGKICPTKPILFGSRTARVTRIIRTSFLATNIRHQFVKRLECINILSSAFSCCWRIFVSQKISDPRALSFRWFWVRRTKQCINLARTTSLKAPKVMALGLVWIILVTLKSQPDHRSGCFYIPNAILTNTLYNDIIIW